MDGEGIKMVVLWAHQDARYGRTQDGKRDSVQIGQELHLDLLAAFAKAESVGMMLGPVECQPKSITRTGDGVYIACQPLSAKFVPTEEIEKTYLS